MEAFHNEADTRAKLIDPALHQRGWSEDKIKREETPGVVDVIDGKPRKRAQRRIDYTLRVRVNSDTQPVALALVEAKSEQYSKVKYINISYSIIFIIRVIIGMLHSLEDMYLADIKILRSQMAILIYLANI